MSNRPYLTVLTVVCVCLLGTEADGILSQINQVSEYVLDALVLTYTRPYSSESDN